jgi:2-oxoglutarate dehydrogenase E2 component (dihydrolipoamide succinyltransferase)
MEIVMPKMGESVSEGTIIKWHKKVGDKVERDEIIFEISTDKVDTEIPSPAAGIIQEIKVPEGETVEVGSVVAVISENGETSVPAALGEEKPRQVQVSENKEEKKIEKQKEIREETEKKKPEVRETISGETKSEEGIIEISMPKMGESVMEGTIIKWHKKVGDKVQKDETIFEISTDKVDTEVPSPAEGILSEILVAEQETVEVGTIVAKLSTSDKEFRRKEVTAESKQLKGEKPLVTMTEKPASEERKIPEQMHEAFSTGQIERAETVEGENSGFYSPLIINIARKENIGFDELSGIKGTGLEGRLTKKDLLSYIESKSRKKAVPEKEKEVYRVSDIKEKPKPAAVPKPDLSFTGQISGGIERIPMDNIRQKIMQHMVNSRDTSVHVTTMLEVDMTKIYNFIQKRKDEYLQKEGVKLTYLAFIAYGAVKALKEYPLVNSTIDGTTILQKKFINLGIAVAVEPTGLIVPNIKAADERNIVGLAKAINDIASRARNKRLVPDDITGGTFTITNYGVFGAIFGTPIINQPEVAILGVGSIEKKPVVIEVEGADTIAIKPIMILTLAHDHRLIDGMLGSKFLKHIKDMLENFDPAVM